MDSDVARQRRSEWGGHWTLVMASAVGMSLAPIVTYTMGIFITPLEEEFGWNRAAITSGMTVNAIFSVILAPLVGGIIDRYGPRRIAIPGVLLFCLFFGCLATVSASLWHWWLIWVGIALSALMVKPTVWAKAIVGRFDKSRGLALAIMLSGSGLTGIAAPLLAGYLIEPYGWRGAYVGIGLVYFLIVMPLVLAFFYGATDRPRQMPKEEAVAAEPLLQPGSTIKAALSTTIFWKLAFAVLMSTMIVTGGLVHFVPAVTQAGIDRTSAVALTSAIGFAAVGGRLITGFLLDRINARLVGSIAFILPAVSFAILLLLGGNVVAAFTAAILLGLASGAEFEVATYLTSRFFGMRNFGALFGTIAGFAGLASGIGAPLAGFVYDRFGAYEVALLGAVGFALVASVLIVSLPAYARRT